MRPSVPSSLRPGFHVSASAFRVRVSVSAKKRTGWNLLERFHVSAFRVRIFRPRIASVKNRSSGRGRGLSTRTEVNMNGRLSSINISEKIIYLVRDHSEIYNQRKKEYKDKDIASNSSNIYRLHSIIAFQKTQYIFQTRYNAIRSRYLCSFLSMRVHIQVLKSVIRIISNVYQSNYANCH